MRGRGKEERVVRSVKVDFDIEAMALVIEVSY